ncbi:MAG: VCBS repeat-containing protein, partial [bacterium]|nr:VCBS repeat-containing protein [bacterium]
DVLVANGADSRAGQVSPLLQNNGDGTFSNITTTTGISTQAASATAAAAADYDNDGDLDLYIVHSRFPNFPANQLYRNNPVNTQTVKVRVRRKNAADGLGTRVRLLQGAQVQGHILITETTPEAIFGTQTGVSYTIEAIFPGGTTATRTGVSTGTTVEIDQP